MRKVIAFCGVEGSGKDYSCQRLLMTKGYEKAAFATSLRPKSPSRTHDTRDALHEDTSI